MPADTLPEIEVGPSITQKDLKRKLKEFRANERESSVLIDHQENLVYIETTHLSTAKKLLKIARQNPEKVQVDDALDSFRMVMPAEFCRSIDLIIKPDLRV